MRFAPVRQSLSVTLLWVVLLLVPTGIELNGVITNGGVGRDSGAVGITELVIGTLFGGASEFLNYLSLVFLFGVALYTIRITVGKMVLGVKCHLSALFYMLFVAVMAGGSVSFEAGLAAILFAKSCSLYIQSFRRDIISYDFVFRAGFMLGVTPLIFGQMLVLFPLTLIACIAFRRSLREYLLTIAGYIMPFMMASYICWMFGLPLGSVAINIWESIMGNGAKFLPVLDQPIEKLAFLGLYIVLAIVAIVGFKSRRHELRNSTVRMFTVFIFAVVLSLAMLLLPTYTPAEAVITAMPFSIIIPALFTRFHNGFSLICYLAALLGGVGIIIARIMGVL